MPRKVRLRKVVAPPKFKGYKPYGNTCKVKEKIELLYEEYEALKLADYRLLNHKEAAMLMGVSRPTFARIYESARRKIAHALVESKEIIAVYGNVILDGSWYSCDECSAKFTIPSTIDHHYCPICRSSKFTIASDKK